MEVKMDGHQLVGSRLVGNLPGPELVHLWSHITSAVIKYGFVIEYADLEPPRTGTFDGLKIVIDPDVGFEMQCFILLHLFGHSVQWVAPSLAGKLTNLTSTTDREQFLQALRDYEFEAAQYGIQLMHQVGIDSLDQWYSDFVETDWRYVRHYYVEGEIPQWDTCVATQCSIIEPLAIPPLQHQQVEVRFAF